MVPILGWYNQRNIGDDAFKDAFIWAAKQINLSEPLHFFIENLPHDVDRVILGGGDVIRPYYIEKLASKVSIVPIGVGLGYESEVRLLDPMRVPFAVVRNKIDTSILLASGIDAIYCPDLTFVIDPSTVEPKVANEKKVLTVLLTDEINPTFERRASAEYSYYEYFKWELASCLDFLSEFYHIVFVSFSSLWSIDDRKVALDVFRRMECRNDVRIDAPVTCVNEARRAIARSDLVVSMKFHGVMFAVQESVPFVCISESRKVETFCMENDLQDFFIPRFSLHKERFLGVVKKAEANNAVEKIHAVSNSLRLEARSLLPSALARFVALQ